MGRTVRTTSKVETRNVGAELAQGLSDGAVVLLSGDLGAGKTQFAQGIAEGLGVTEPVTSPTFNIVFEYASGRVPLYHFDLYRLEDAQQLEDIDFHALVDESTPGVALIEWADLFPAEMPEDAITVTITKDATDPSVRIIAIT